MSLRFGDRSRVSSPVSGWVNRETGLGFNKPLHQVMTSFTVGAVAHTKTSYTEIVSSTSANCNLLMVDGRVFVSAAETSWLVDIAVGPVGSESIIVPNLSIGQSAGYSPRIIPIFIPIGSRISARVQSNRTNDTRDLQFKLYQGPSLGLPQQVDVIGTSTATSRPTIITAVDTWQQLTASTSQRYQQIILCGGVNSASVTSAIFYSIRLATGAAGSETERAATAITSNTSETFSTSVAGLATNVSGANSATLLETYFADVAAGTRLSVRTSSLANITSAFAIGVPYT